MIQKVFDTDNADDMARLWDILPDDVYKIENRFEDFDEYYFEGFKGEGHIDADLILIDWHGKTEITRPIQEATDDDVGKLCKFWTGKDSAVGILKEIGDYSSADVYCMEVIGNEHEKGNIRKI